jgi:transposase
MHRRPKYSPEFRERAVRLVLQSDRTIKDVAEDLGMNPGTLTCWVGKDRERRRAAVPPLGAANGELDGKTLRAAERERLRELERENRELRRANEILKAATAFFAQEADPTRPQR